MSDTENDPAADFLAREQQDLGNLADDDDFAYISGGSNLNTNNGNEDIYDNIPQNGTEKQDDHVSNEGDAADMNGGWNPPGMGGEENMFGEQQSAPLPRVPEPESEKLIQWRVEFKERIEKMDEKEVAKKAELEKEAKKELEDWYKHRAEQTTKRHSINREQEEAILTERDRVEPGGEWERVCRLVEFNPKSASPAVGPGSAGNSIKGSPGPAGTTDRLVTGARDTSRMRGILLTLKKEPLKR